MRRAQPEATEQVLFFKRVALHPKTRDLPITATANGGLRNVITAANLKRQGVRAGVPDILCFAKGRADGWRDRDERDPITRHGLAIEMKVKPNRTTLQQDEWLDMLAANGWRVAVCYSADEAWHTLTDYLGIPG